MKRKNDMCPLVHLLLICSRQALDSSQAICTLPLDSWPVIQVSFFRSALTATAWQKQRRGMSPCKTSWRSQSPLDTPGDFHLLLAVKITPEVFFLKGSSNLKTFFSPLKRSFKFQVTQMEKQQQQQQNFRCKCFPSTKWGICHYKCLTWQMSLLLAGINKCFLTSGTALCVRALGQELANYGQWAALRLPLVLIVPAN